MTRRFGIAERRARLGARHHLAPGWRGETPTQVADSLIGLHATDPASVYLAARARLADGATSVVEHALYQRRSLVRMLAMRRTMWVTPTALAPVLQAGATAAVARRMRARLVAELVRGGVGGDDSAAWLADLETAVLVALTRRGAATGAQLSADEPLLRTQLTYAEDKSYGGPVAITSRVLNLMSAEARIVRGRPRGSWVSSQYEWWPASAWWPDSRPEWATESAQAELVSRYLTAFGPATAADLKWWTGWTMREVRQALSAHQVVEVDLEVGPGQTQTGLLLESDAEHTPQPDPWVALLPALDPTAMGWTARDWYLPAEHRPALFDRSGNVAPTVWWCGQVVGGWGQRTNGEVVFTLLEDPGAEATAAVEVEAGKLTEWLAGVRVTPRFRTPLEKELAAW